MASADGGPGLPATSRGDLSEFSDSDSNSNSTRSSVLNSPCPYRTSRLSDRECARYLDCPTHLQERSDVENGDGGAGPSSAPEPVDADNQSDLEQEPPPPNGAPRTDAVSPPRGEDDRDDMCSSVPDVQTRDDVSTLDDGSRNGASSPQHTDELSHSSDSEDEGVAEDAAEDAAEAPITLRQALEETRESQNGSTPNEAAPPQINHTTAGPISRASLPNPPMASPHNPRTGPRSPADFALPRWQPDAEVTCCPICRTQFGFFVRKHHCR